MMINALPDIALTGLSDWQQAQTLIVNTRHKQFPSRTHVPFGGSVFPADLVLKMANLERENARQRQALEEKELYANTLLRENSEHIMALAEADNDEALRKRLQRHTRRLQKSKLALSNWKLPWWKTGSFWLQTMSQPLAVKML